MKRKNLIFSLVVLCSASFAFQSCIGSFALTNKVLTWNRNVSNKFLNEVVFFAFWVLPVYEVTAAADLLVINSIEFWSGNNPMVANNQIIETENGNYQILKTQLGYAVNSPDGNTIEFEFDENSNTWSIIANNQEKLPFLKLKDASHVKIINADGNFVDVELSPEGVENYKNMIPMPMMAMY